MQSIIKLFGIGVITMCFSCESKDGNLEAEMIYLKQKNDSLQTIIDTLNTKYIFDDVFPAVKRTKPNTIENGVEYFNGEIFMMASNKSDYLLMSQKQSDEGDIISPDTLYPKSMYGPGYFEFKIKVTGNDKVVYSLESKNKLGGKDFAKVISMPINKQNFP